MAGEHSSGQEKQQEGGWSCHILHAGLMEGSANGAGYKTGRPASGAPPPPKRLYLLKFLQLPQTLLPVREQMFKDVLWRTVHIQIVRPHDYQMALGKSGCHFWKERHPKGVMHRLGGHYWSRPFNHRNVGSFR